MFVCASWRFEGYVQVGFPSETSVDAAGWMRSAQLAQRKWYKTARPCSEFCVLVDVPMLHSPRYAIFRFETCFHNPALAMR